MWIAGGSYVPGWARAVPGSTAVTEAGAASPAAPSDVAVTSWAATEPSRCIVDAEPATTSMRATATVVFTRRTRLDTPMDPVHRILLRHARRTTTSLAWRSNGTAPSSRCGTRTDPVPRHRFVMLAGPDCRVSPPMA